MKRLILTFISLLSVSLFSQSYPPAAGQEGSTAISFDSDLFNSWATMAEVSRGYMDISNPDLGFANFGSPENAIGVADNSTISLGDAGVAILTFDRPISNGSGFDFAVFENAFNDTFLELAFVEVSSDGVNYFRFPAHSQTQTQTQVGGFDPLDPTYLNNLAGKYKAFFGTPFDLDDLENHSLLDKNAITHIKILDVVGSINPDFGSFDALGNLINDPFPTPFGSSGFDLDAVGVINEASLSNNVLDSISLKIYPNPTKDFFYIGILDAAKIQIIDLNGRKILELNSVQNQAIPIHSLKSGQYFVLIETANRKSLHQLIKK